jgi:phosphoglycolate phosphatase-like HAD superfamily hydrolase
VAAESQPGGIAPALDGVDLVVFDKDGTLISFDAMWVGWTRALGSRLETATGRPVAGDVFAAIGFDPAGGRVLPGGPLAVATMAEIEDRVAAVIRRWCPNVAAARRAIADAWFEPDPVAEAVPLADLVTLFETLAASGRRIAIATTDDRRPTEATIAGLGLAGLVDAVACGDDDGPRKPDPATFVEICDALAASPGRAAIVSDTAADLRMGRDAGAGRTIGVLSGVSTAAELGPFADRVMRSVQELLDGTTGLSQRD